MNSALTSGDQFAAVAIGRNEGERLKRCLTSLSQAAAVIYVDSGSSDGSVEWARRHSVHVIELDKASPFTAARARNAGFEYLKTFAPDIPYVQFIDGDCELSAGWAETAIEFLNARSDVAVVSGRLRELHPERSVYNWLCQLEWDGPVGEVRFSGGIVMMRVQALEESAGYRADLIAGEEPELCVRLRRAGWRIWRLDKEMATHDAAITRFGQWWRRATRNGYAVAQGSHLHGKPPERMWVWEARRTRIWGIYVPLIFVATAYVLGPFGWAILTVFPLQILRSTLRASGTLKERIIVSSFYLLARFPEAVGQIRFLRDRFFARSGRLIEYK